MVGNKNVLLAFIVGLFVKIAVADADQKEPRPCPKTAQPVNNIPPAHFAEERSHYYWWYNQQHTHHKHNQGIQAINNSQNSHVFLMVVQLIFRENATYQYNLKKRTENLKSIDSDQLMRSYFIYNCNSIRSQGQ